MTQAKKPTASIWRQGRLRREHDQLGAGLRDNARWHARRALEGYLADDHHEQLSAAVSVGCAVELMAKSVLVGVEPTLLLDKNDPVSILHLSGKGHRTETAATATRTRGALECMAVVKDMIPSLRWQPKTDDGLVLSVRNAALHMAIAEPKELETAVRIMVRIVDDLVKLFGSMSREDFWGQHSLLVADRMLDEAASEIRRGVEAKLSAAKSRLARAVEHLTAEMVEALLSTLSGAPGRSSGDHEEAHECPVCKQQGWLICVIERGSLYWESDGDGGGYALVPRTAYPLAFECPVCRLELEGQELDDSQFDFPDEVDLEDDEASDEERAAFDAWEPDEDYWRDR